MVQLKNLFLISFIFIISIHTDIRHIRQRYYLSNSDLFALFCKRSRYYLSHGDLISLGQFSEKEVGWDCHSLFCFVRVAPLCKWLRWYLSHGDLIAFGQFPEKEVGYDCHCSLCFIRGIRVKVSSWRCTHDIVGYVAELFEGLFFPHLFHFYLVTVIWRYIIIIHAICKLIIIFEDVASARRPIELDGLTQSHPSNTHVWKTASPKSLTIDMCFVSLNLTINYWKFTKNAKGTRTLLWSYWWVELPELLMFASLRRWLTHTIYVHCLKI